MRLVSKAGITLALVTSMLAGCATPATDRTVVDPNVVAKEQELQRRLVLRKDLEYQLRLSRVAYPIQDATRSLCVNDWGRDIGIEISNLHEHEPEYWMAAQEVLGIDDSVRLIGITPGSAAEGAGLEVGDQLLAVNRVAIKPGASSMRVARTALRDAATSGDPVELIVQRGEKNLLFTLAPDPVCYYPSVLARQDDVNAFADGTHVYVSRGMMRFAQTDDELSLVIAHEMAHNAMGHIEAQRGNQMLGTVIDVAAAAYGLDTKGLFGDLAGRAHSQDFESEADYVALYVLARANIRIDEAADFWRRMAIESPQGIEGGYFATHPSTAARYVALDDTVDEIFAKRDAQESLMPNLKRRMTNFDQAPRAFGLVQQVVIETRSGGPASLPSGCWKRAGRVQEGDAYRPLSGAITVHGQEAFLVVDASEAVGVWQPKRQRYLALDVPVRLDDIAEPLFVCTPVE
jgi:hypothetical protein